MPRNISVSVNPRDIFCPSKRAKKLILLKDLTKSKECVNIECFPINMVSGDFSKLKINFALYQIAK